MKKENKNVYSKTLRVWMVTADKTVNRSYHFLFTIH